MRALPVVVAVLLVVTPVVGMSSGPLSPTAHEPTHAVEPPIVDTVPRSADDAVARFWARSSVANGTASNHTDSTLNRTTNVLGIPENRIARSTHRRHHVDLGPAVGFATNATSARLATLAVIERVNRAPADERRQAIQRALDGIDAEIDTLRQREQDAIAAYSAGTITPRQFLIRLARVHIRAQSLAERRAALVRIAEEQSISLDQGRLAVLERRIDSLTGPVRAEAVSVLRGESPPSRFYVATGPQSVILSTIDGDTFVREVYRGDRYRQGGTDIDPERALRIVAENYPVIWETRQNNTEVTGSQGNYLVTVPHARGMLFAFVDGGSEAVYKEFQRRPLATIDDFEGVSAIKDGLRLTINRSYPGAPLRIRLVDVETDRPVDANITLGQGNRESKLIGQTGSDGELWTLSPRGRYTITAIRGNSVVVLTADPAETPRIGATSNATSNSTSNATA